MKLFPRLRAYSFTPGDYLFAAVFVVRVLNLARFSRSPLFLPFQGDMHFYDDWAQRITRGEVHDPFAFYGLPLYAYLLAFLYKVFGYGPFFPSLLQAFLDAGTAVLIYRITRVLFSSAPASTFIRSTTTIWCLLAGAAWAVFVPAQAYSIILMPTAWLIFVFWLVVWRIIKKEEPPSIKECLIFGLLVGFTAMGVATILFLLPLVFAAIFFKHKIDNTKARSIACAACVLVGVVLGTSPCWIHNYFLARDPVFLSAHSGINFWIGNNPEANGYPRFPPGLRAGQAAMLEDSIAVAESSAGRSLKRAEVSAFWSNKARNYITHHSVDWLRLLARKFRNFWSAFQYDDLSIITTLRESGVIFPGIYFGLVAALALPGMLFAWRLAPPSRWIAAAIFLHMAALLPVFVTERYRLPIVPGLLVFAAFGLSIFWQKCAAAEYRTASVYAALLVASTIFVSWPQRDPSLWALDAYNSGWQALESGNLPLAEKKLSLARAYVPQNAETNFALGNLRLAQGDRRQAADFYRDVLQIDPSHKSALNNLGVMALDAHNLVAARRFFENALAQDRHSAKTHFLLAKTAVAAGDRAMAENEISKALEIAPKQPEFLALRQQLKTTAPSP